MKPRTLTKTLFKALKTFPVIVVTGPRQSGKTTLLKTLFSRTHKFVSLEDPDVRIRAKEDPISFLNQYAPPVIIDEIQYVPELLSYIKTRVDEKRAAGQWLLTGSQNFVLMQGVSQSLAGRAAILSLLPFSIGERINKGLDIFDTKTLLHKAKASTTFLQKRIQSPSLSEIILRGNYPEIASKKAVDRQLWCGSYLSTYFERDVRNIANIGNLTQFERFLKLCATRTGQILQLSDMARDIGISVPTAKRWLTILETSYQISLLYPYYKNIGKRIIKSPKLYFGDTALASYLLGIHENETLLNSPNFSNLFETMVINDFLKRFIHFGQAPSLYYLRTRDGLEVDMAIEINQKLHLIEIKSSGTITPHHATGLKRMRGENGKIIGSASIISRTETNFMIDRNIANYNWQTLLTL